LLGDGRLPFGTSEGGSDLFGARGERVED